MREEVAAHYRAKGYTIRERVQVRGASGAVHSVEMVAQGPLGNLVVAFEDAGGFEGPELGAVRRIARDIGATPVVAARRFDDGLRRHAAQSGVVLLDEAALQTPPPAPPADAQELEYPPWPEPGAVQEAREQVPWPTRGHQVAARDDASPMDAVGDALTLTVPRSKSTDPGFWRYPRPGQADAPEDHGQGRDAAPSGRTSTRVPSDLVGSAHAMPSRRPSFDWLAAPADAGPRAVTGTGSRTQGRLGDTGAGHGSARGRPLGATAAAPAVARASPTAAWTRWAALGAGFGASAAIVFYALLRLFG